MKPRHKRFVFIALGMVCLILAIVFVMRAFNENLMLYFTPTQVAGNEAPVGQVFRIGGMVEEKSLKRLPDGLTVEFRITDTARTIPVAYSGILPDLFKEGRGAVVQGKLGSDGVFRANQVLAKHDENYMPPEAAHAVEQAQKAQRTLRQ